MNTARPYVMKARAEAAAATRARILASTRALLLTHTFDQMTVEAIAKGADTTVRTVLRLFGHKEEVFAEALDSIEGFGDVPIVPGDIDGMIRSTYGFYEKIGDTVIRWLADEPRVTAMRRHLKIGRRHLRNWIGEAFAPTLERLEGDRRKQLHDALIVAFDVYTWKLLRRDFGLSRSAAEGVVRRMVMALIREEENG